MINTVEKAYRDLVRIGSEIEMSNSYMISMIEKKASRSNANGVDKIDCRERREG